MNKSARRFQMISSETSPLVHQICDVSGYMRDVEATSRCVYKVLYFPFWIRSSRALVFNIESDNNVGDPPERSWKI